MTGPTDPVHPDFGVRMCCRVRILMHANVHGTKASAERFGVHRSTIYKWRHRVPHDLAIDVPECCGLSVGPLRRACFE